MKITKEILRQLPPEQQEALATMELERAMKRQRLLDEVGGHPVTRWLPVLFMLFVFCALFLAVFIITGRYAPGIILPVALVPCCLIQVQMVSINRRLDALVELLDDDKKESGSDA
jgi:hypothetical protein